MKSKFLAAAMAAVLSSGAIAAQAADLVITEEPAAPAAAAEFNWTGFYLGGTVGGSWAQSKNRLSAHGQRIAGKTVNPDGVIGGVYGGYAYQLPNNVVVGAETDWLWDDVNDSARRGLTGDSYGKLRAKQNWNGATRLRTGYAFDRFLPYIAAGVSYADNSNALHLYGKNNQPVWKKSKGDTRAGWNVGVGLDYAPDFAFLGPVNDHLVVRAEYRYTDFGNDTYKLPNDSKVRVKYNQNDFRAGVAYKF